MLAIGRMMSCRARLRPGVASAIVRQSMVVKSMPGGGNVLATNFMYVSAPKERQVMGPME